MSIEVGTNDASVTLTNNATGETTRVATSPGKDTSIPIPNVPPGTALTIRIGRGRTARLIVIEVIAPGP